MIQKSSRSLAAPKKLLVFPAPQNSTHSSGIYHAWGRVSPLTVVSSVTHAHGFTQNRVLAIVDAEDTLLEYSDTISSKTCGILVGKPPNVNATGDSRRVEQGVRRVFQKTLLKSADFGDLPCF